MVRFGLPLATALALLASAALASDSNGRDTHINVPFVNLDIHHKADGSHHVEVNAPFAHVDKPADTSQTTVTAPFTHVSDPQGGDVKVKAPFTHVYAPADNSPTQVKAPFTKVNQPKVQTQVKVEQKRN